MKKILSMVLSVVLLVTVFAGCNDKAPGVDISAIAISGPSGVAMANLMQSNKEGTAANNYSFSVVTSPDGIIAKIASGECDIAALPTNLASTLYAKTNGGVQILAVSTLGVLYILENGQNMQSIADLKGKEIYSTGQGANPEYILNHILSKNGIDPKKDVTIKFLSENEELAAAMVGGTAKVALVPQPVATTIMNKNPQVTAAFDMTQEWKKVSGDSALMMSCVVVRKEFAEKNKAAVKAFMKEYKASIEKATTDLDGTAALCESFEIIPSAALAKQAIPKCNLVYIDGDQMKQELTGYLTVLYDANVKSVGGKLPDDNFFYKK